MPLNASCHCGAVRIEIAHAPTELTECNCSYCARTGGLWAYYEVDEVRELVTEGKATYAPSIVNEHYFCSRCGMTTHGTSPDYTLENAENHTIPDGRRASINARMLEDFDISTLPVTRIDGRNLW
jgi:hypothetical protein